MIQSLTLGANGTSYFEMTLAAGAIGSGAVYLSACNAQAGVLHPKKQLFDRGFSYANHLSHLIMR
jgi:hypothetical protein